MSRWRVIGQAIGFVIMATLAWETLRRGLTPAPSGTLLGILDGANFIFHEAGHVLFMFFGEFLQILGGSLTQVAIPALCAAYFLFRGQAASAAAALFWAGESATHVAIYVADARRMALPLHGGESVIHDWNYLLGRLGLIAQANTAGQLVFAVGAITILSALGLLALELLRCWQADAAADADE